MDEIRSQQQGDLSSTLLLDGEEVRLMSIQGSSMVKSVGYSSKLEEIFIEYRDCIWGYPCSEKEWAEVILVAGNGESVGRFITNLFKPRGGRKLYQG